MLYVDLLAGAVSIVALEFFLRIAIKRAPEESARDSPQGFRYAMRDLSRQLELFTATEPHPFLQYTRPRTLLVGGDQRYGFSSIKLSDVPKPAGVVRIACIGGSATEGGYPELLEAFLNAALPARRFQVLDFAVDGWASVHSMLNFILNVREFHPDFVVVGDELRGAGCSGYPCCCRGRVHDYTPLAYRDNPLDEWMLRASWIYRACKILLVRSRIEAFDRDGREIQQYRRNIETICTLAALDKIQVILLTAATTNHDSIKAVNETIRATAKARVALLDLEQTDDRIAAERIGKMIAGMHPGARAE
jgi:hypothetical protein